MLPPPTTIATSTPSVATCATWRAINWIASGSSPCPVSRSPRASPESLSSTRWYAMRVVVPRSGARLEQAEGFDARALAQRVRQGLLDADRRILHPGLLGEHDALVVLLELALEDLADAVGGLALQVLALAVDRTLALDRFLRHGGAGQRVGAVGHHVHAELLDERVDLLR